MALMTLSSSWSKLCVSRGMGGEGRHSHMQGCAQTLLPAGSSIPRPASRSTAYSAEAPLLMSMCSPLAASAGQGLQWISRHQHPSHRTGATSILEVEVAIQAANLAPCGCCLL